MWKFENNKGQVAMEFIFLVALALTTLVIFFFLNYATRADITEGREYDALADTAYAIRTELYTATTVSDGYLRVFNLPNTIDSRDYNITTIGDVVQLEGDHASFSLQVPLFNGTLQKGDNVLRKTNGGLHVN